MNKPDIKVGDKIVHKSNKSVVWIVEEVEKDEVYCSTLLKDTKEQKREKFVLTSIEKYEPPPHSSIKVISGRKNYY